MFIYILLFLIGCVLLYFGSEILINNSILLSKKFKISPIVVGATVIALGTSLPELLISIYSIIFTENISSSGLILGNVLGSNIANVSLVLGYCAFMYTVIIEKNFLKELIFIFLLGIYSIFCLYYQVTINYVHGIILLILFFYYLFNLLNNNKIDNSIEDDIRKTNLLYNIFYIFLSMIALSLGSHFLVDNAIKIAVQSGVATLSIGVTIVALGTSLPELFTGVLSIKKRNYNLLIGNIIGSNVINIVFVLGFSSLLINIKPEINSLKLFNIAIAFILSHLIFIFSYLFNKSISKISGFLLLLLYLIFLYKIF